MFKHLDSVDTAGIGTVGIYDDEQAFRTGQAPLRTFRLKAKPTRPPMQTLPSWALKP